MITSSKRAADGLEALEKADSFGPDLILLDYMMPRLTTASGAQRLRSSRSGIRATPVILLTAKASQEDKVRGLDAGADDYVVKPFDAVELPARCAPCCASKRCTIRLEEWSRNLADQSSGNRFRSFSGWNAVEAVSVAANRGDGFARKTAICLKKPPAGNYGCVPRPPRISRPSPITTEPGRSHGRCFTDTMLRWEKVVFAFEGTLVRFARATAS